MMLAFGVSALPGALLAASAAAIAAVTGCSHQERCI